MSVEQQRLVGTVPEADAATIQTSGRVIRPAVAPITAVADECKLHVSPDGVATTVVDPANVAITRQRIHPAAFESFSLDGETFTTGVSLTSSRRGDDTGLADLLANARKGRRTDDPVALSVGPSSITAEVTREYADTSLTFADELLTIDPDSVREEPEPPSLEWPASVTVAPAALQAAVEHLDRVGDELVVTAVDGQLVFGAGDDDASGRFGTAVSFDAPVEGLGDDEAPTSRLSLDYLTDAADALVDALVDSVTIQFGDEFPVRFGFERTNDDGAVLYEGVYLQAPRISDGDGE